MSVEERLATAVHEFDRAYKKFSALVTSGVLANTFEQEAQREAERLRGALRHVRGQLFLVVARVRAAQGKGPLADDLKALIDSLDEAMKGGTDAVSAVSRDGEVAALRIVGGAGREDVR